MTTTVTARFSRWLLAALVTLALAACIPIPVISVSPSPVVGEEVTFDASETMVSNMPEDNVAVSHDWDFGDGNSGDGRSVTHTYDKAGTYKVTLTVVDSAGREGRATENVNVKVAQAVSSPSVVGDAGNVDDSSTR